MSVKWLVTRKPHICWGCNQLIQSSVIMSHNGKCYFCEDCQEILDEIINEKNIDTLELYLGELKETWDEQNIEIIWENIGVNKGE